MNRERVLDLAEEEIDTAHRDGALTGEQARTMQADVDRQRKALYAQEAQELWDEEDGRGY